MLDIAENTVMSEKVVRMQGYASVEEPNNGDYQAFSKQFTKLAKRNKNMA